ncbi:UvrD-helicase domain-containing protein [Flavihumibacter sp. UBA7668]|uniref:UvrD-helicase domain-containing protein n=1 Tax=Flavihumibacter sp. UBA7668 TaxID=1946542 RepID=UPI0025B9827B|nr:ATP-dependent helicase [Flavihumibacter sp. UBA7668]
MSIEIIDANHHLSDIECHFKVFAGPGAGKTRFLVNHIRNVLNNSQRLQICRKIACITFTNVATETILKRAGDHGGRLEISTIHSFLYKYIVKPYVHLIADEYDLKAEAIDGHDDILFSGYQFLKEWKSTTAQTYLDDGDIASAFERLRWKFDGNGDLAPLPPYPQKSGKYNFKPDSYWIYKRMVWKKGLLHHDDILFFSHQIIKKLPFALEVLRAQFPYFIVDEFQDTSPIQIEILRLIGQKETIVGIVGDEAQSIYKFLGAVPGQLKAFTLPGMKLFEIKDNHRSSNQIVDLLNKIRPTLYQDAKRGESHTSITMVIGDKAAALQWTEATHAGRQVVSLCRENLTANSLKKGIAASIQKNLLIELKEKDGNSTRRRAVSNATKAVENARMGYFKDALKTIEKLFNYKKSDLDKKRSLKCLKLLLDNYSQYSGKKVIDLYNLLNNEGTMLLSKLSKGAAKTFYETTEYDFMAAAVKNLYEAGNHRTIHKSKGEEFETVLLVLDKDEKGQFNEMAELSFFLKPDLENDEEHRIKYVAISRPRNHLVISAPSISAHNIPAIEKLGINIQIL